MASDTLPEEARSVRRLGGMYAIVRKNHYDQGQLTDKATELAEFQRLHEEQPGFRGTLSVQAEDGSAILVNLWNSEEDARAGLTRLGPEVQRLLSPVMSESSELVGAGPVSISGQVAQALS